MNTDKVICFIGAHGTGKTSLINGLTENLDNPTIVLEDFFRHYATKLGYDRPRDIIQEGGDLRRELSISSLTSSAIGACSLIESSVKKELILMDQGPVAYFAYYNFWILKNAKELGQTVLVSPFIEKLCNYYSTFIDRYFYCPTGIVPIVGDGMRPTDLEFQHQIDTALKDSIDYLKIQKARIHVLESVTVKERVVEVTKILERV